MMQQRGRKSLEAVSAPAITTVVRPDPPEGVSEEVARVWVETVERMPADWFVQGEPYTLVQYCRHVVAANRVQMLIRLAETDDEMSVDEYDKLLKMQERETRAILSAATKMRLTQQSTLDPDKRKNPKRSRTPWQG